MRFFDYIRLALKNLTRQKARTTLTIIAITVGSLSLILMISILISVRQSLMDTFKAMGAFNLVTVVRDPNSIDNTNLIGSGNNSPTDDNTKKIDDTTLAAVKKMPGVSDAVAIPAGPWFKTMRLDGNDKKTWSSLLASDPSADVFDLILVAGRKLNSTDMDKVVVGSDFLTKYGDPSNPSGLLGKKVLFSSDKGAGYPDWGDLPPKPPFNADKSWWDSQNQGSLEISAEIVGVANNSSMDSQQNYITLGWAHKLMTQLTWQEDDNGMKECQQQQQQQQQAVKMSGNYSNNNSSACDSFRTMTLVKTDNFLTNGYGSIIAKVYDTSKIQSVADQITKLGYGAVTAQNMIDNINNAMLMVGIVLSVIGGISLFVAAIGIINTMVMATFERIREIGVMRACGATRAIIRRLFTFEAALLGFWGGVFGLVISFILVRVVKILVTKYGASLGNLPISNIGNFPWWLVVSVIVFTTLIGMLSGLGPAIRAARLNPVDALRYE
ncbi:MAG: ABC transporter permease [Candidatus Berkelbacteria bacterium]|nr:ABC transporter permease [Candidatus Berkelbacteria bacterium]